MGKFLAGFDIWLSETTGDMSFKAYFVEGNTYDEAFGNLLAARPVDVTEVDVPMIVQHFLTCFKRFNHHTAEARTVPWLGQYDQG